MTEVVLKAEPRTVIGKQVRALRRAGGIPAVLYGRHMQPTAITLDQREASRILPHITSSQLVIIELEGKQHHALVREKQRHPVQGSLLHVDFNAVSMTEKLRAYVLVHLVGESTAVKDFNAVLVPGIEQIEVECLPKYLPDRIVVDIASLKSYGDAIHVRDIVLDDQIEILTDPDEIVAVATTPAAEEKEAAEAGAEEPEVIERGKKEAEDF